MPRNNAMRHEYEQCRQNSNAIISPIEASDDFNRKLRVFEEQIEKSGGLNGRYMCDYNKLNATYAHDYRPNKMFNCLSSDDNPRSSYSSSSLSINSDVPVHLDGPRHQDPSAQINVREKIQFFNNSTSTSRCTSASPFYSSEDDECELYRQNSIRNFQRKREYFERILHARQQSKLKGYEPTPIELHDEIDVDEEKSQHKQAVRQYFQTSLKILLEAMSNSDAKRLGHVDKQRLRKLFDAILDAVHRCQEMYCNVDEEFAREFQQNIASALELLFSTSEVYFPAQSICLRGLELILLWGFVEGGFLDICIC